MTAPCRSTCGPSASSASINCRAARAGRSRKPSCGPTPLGAWAAGGSGLRSTTDLGGDELVATLAGIMIRFVRAHWRLIAPAAAVAVLVAALVGPPLARKVRDRLRNDNPTTFDS